jgi:hypothetical protein
MTTEPSTLQPLIKTVSTNEFVMEANNGTGFLIKHPKDGAILCQVEHVAMLPNSLKTSFFATRRSKLSEKFVNRLGTTAPRVVVIDNHETTRRHLRIEILETHFCRLIAVAVETKDRNWRGRSEGRYRVSEPTFNQLVAFRRGHLYRGIRFPFARRAVAK